MIQKILVLALLAIAIVCSSCSKKIEAPVRLKVEELIKSLGPVSEVKKSDPNALTFRAEYYGEGLIADSFKILSYKDLSFILVEFETEEFAKNEALRLKQYYHKNWLIDEVSNEPSLEDLIVYKIHAINPSLKHQRVPKHIPEEAHGDSTQKASGGH